MAIDRSKERMKRVTEPLFNFNVEKVGPLNKQGSPMYMHEGKPHGSETLLHRLPTKRTTLDPLPEEPEVKLKPRGSFADAAITGASEITSERISPAKQRTDPPKNSAIAGQGIHESGHTLYNIEGGPDKGDLIRGEHLQYKPSGRVEDLDYKVQFAKDTSDVSGPYKIWETTGIKTDE